MRQPTIKELTEAMDEGFKAFNAAVTVLGLGPYIATNAAKTMARAGWLAGYAACLKDIDRQKKIMWSEKK